MFTERTLTEICDELKNYFLINGADSIHKGTFTISDGEISSLNFLQEGQYYRIRGSVFNDGVHKYAKDTSLTNEVFEGEVWAMAVPPSVIALASKVEAYNETNNASPFTSESFGGYSYSKATNINGSAITWQGVFATELNKYRRVSAL